MTCRFVLVVLLGALICNTYARKLESSGGSSAAGDGDGIFGQPGVGANIGGVALPGIGGGQPGIGGGLPGIGGVPLPLPGIGGVPLPP
ncbi:FAM10 family protein At4g22670-like [Cornus florida]|uniref:FAM10 family protein At4g22670-like n=1 Tax=Cornus florida TaxID=4283 RepID=UPI0028969FCD|nr:FAM10 family protein At4g22670-like [Cornus florida]